MKSKLAPERTDTLVNLIIAGCGIFVLFCGAMAAYTAELHSHKQAEIQRYAQPQKF